MYIRYPDSVVSGLIKIGGFIAILKIGLVLSMVHGIQYRQAIRQIRSKKESSKQEAEERFTLENFQLMIDTSSVHQHEIK